MRNEDQYKNMVSYIYNFGEYKESRNGNIKERFGMTLNLDVSNNKLPLLVGRKMYPRGIIGEALAFMQTDCKHVTDFTSRGCNYWQTWADKDGNLELDYPIHKQLYRIIEDIKKDPHSRRHIISLWNEDRLEELSLPPCHYAYQFNIEGDKINMIWSQRSADVMVGVPSDMVLATIYLRIVGAATGYEANRIIMHFGSAHIYEEHITKAREYLDRPVYDGPTLDIADKHFMQLSQDDFTIHNYVCEGPIKFELKQ